MNTRRKRYYRNGRAAFNTRGEQTYSAFFARVSFVSPMSTKYRHRPFCSVTNKLRLYRFRTTYYTRTYIYIGIVALLSRRRSRNRYVINSFVGRPFSVRPRENVFVLFSAANRKTISFVATRDRSPSHAIGELCRRAPGDAFSIR